MPVPCPGRALTRRTPLLAPVLAALLAGASLAHAQEVTGGAALLWEADFKTQVALNDEYGKVATAGGLVFAGAVGFGVRPPVLTVEAYDAATSAELWSTNLPLVEESTQIEGDGLMDLVVSPDGLRIYALVEHELVSSLYALDAASGAPIFSKSYEKPLGNQLVALAVSPDGTRIYACGAHNAVPFFIVWVFVEFVTVAFDAADGQVLWEAFYDPSPILYQETAVDVAVSPDGASVYVTGVADGYPATGIDYATLAYGAATGKRRWVAWYNSGAEPDLPSRLAVDPGGARLLVVGGAYGDEVVSYDTVTGTVQWTSTLAAGEFVEHGEPVFAADGSAVYVHALVKADSGDPYDSDVRVARIAAADGAVAWTYDYSAPALGPWTNAVPQGLVLTQDGAQAVISIESTLGELGFHEAVSLALWASDGTLAWAAHDTSAAIYGLHPGGIALTDDGARLAIVADRAFTWPGTADAVVITRSAADGSGLWEAVLDGQGPGEERARSVASAPDGSASALAIVTDGANGSRFDLTVFGASGERLWTWRYEGTWEGSPARTAFAADGGTVFAAHLDDQGLRVEAFDAATGVQRWSTPLAGYAIYGVQSLGLAVDGATGRLFVARDLFLSFATNALDSTTGAVLWEQTEAGGLSGSFDEERLEIALAPDGGRVFVTSDAVPVLGTWDWDVVTVAYDAASGAKLWTANHQGSGRGDQMGTDVAVSPDGTLVAVGGTGVAGDLEDGLVVVHAAATGAQVWSALLPGAVEAVEAGDGLLFVLSNPPGPVPDEHDLRIDAFDLATGALRWSMLLDQGQGSFGTALALEGDGTTLFATGRASAGGSMQTLTLALDASTGQPLWKATHDGGGDETGEALAVDAAGHVLVTASTQDGGASLEDAHIAAYAVPSLVGQPEAFSASAGGGQKLFLRADANVAGGIFLVAGSFSGTAPGFDFQGVHVPLNPDWYLPLSVNSVASPVVGGFGLLDTEAEAKALVAVPPGVALPLVGLTVAHAYGVADPLTGTAEFGSNPVLLAIEP